jgi:hypothetical protein
MTVHDGPKKETVIQKPLCCDSDDGHDGHDAKTPISSVDLEEKKEEKKKEEDRREGQKTVKSVTSVIRDQSNVVSGMTVSKEDRHETVIEATKDPLKVECHLQHVRIAARMEYGINGAVDPNVLAAKLNLDKDKVIISLSMLGYEPVPRFDGSVVFKQKVYTAKEAQA